MQHYLIRDLAQIAGVKAHTIRTWEQRYGLLQPQRDANNIRYYNEHDLLQLLHVASLCGHGWRISRVMQLSEPQRLEEVRRLQVTVSDNYAARLNGLMAAMLDLDEPRLHYLLTEALAEQSVEPVMLQLVYPLLQRVGLAWQTGTLNVAQEHLLSQLVRQKLLVALDALPSFPPPAAPRWLLFLPEKEGHELALLFIAYLLRSQGQHVLYLGSNLPLPDVAAACQTFKPANVLTVLTAGMAPEHVGAFGQELRQSCSDAHLVFYGPLARHLQGQFPENARCLTKVTDVNELLADA